ncbi:hypothetical protein GGH93_003273 [Coemansia aciculifera]|nr:hypothetical protein GGH93_003273 [Coemansia aciculifera]
MVSEIEVVSGCPSADWTLNYRHVHSLVTQLVPRIAHTAHGGYGSLELQLGSISNLTHINFEDKDISPIVQVARQNALTLQSLCIAAHVCGSFTELIKTQSGDYVEYSQLQVLKLNHFSRYRMYGWPTIPGAVPFPKLRLLSVTEPYSFDDDDVLFWGNAATLEYLTLQISRETVTMIKKFGVFTTASQPMLKCVNILGTGYLYPTSFDPYAAYTKFLLDIAPNAAVRTFTELKMVPNASAALSLFGDYTNIQVLGLLDISLQLWDAMALIKSLPLLSDLHSLPPALGPLPDNVTEYELPAYVVANYAPMGRRFRCWHVKKIDTAVTFKDIVTCALLLALVCPNFDYLTPPTSDTQKFMPAMKAAIDKSEFKNYELRLRRLLFGGHQRRDWL